MSIDDYIIIKKLGSGVYGTIYLVKKGKKEYALKIEKILEKEINKDLISPVWREIDFAQKLGDLYPDFFMKLYEYDIIDECNHKQKLPNYISKFKEGHQKSLSERNNSTFCSRKIYSLIDTTLDNVLKKIKDQNQIYSIIIQICYIIYLMNKHGYTHNDVHYGNIGIIYTKKKYINIFDHNIPTYGYQLQIIDYGYVLHNNFEFIERIEMGNKNERDVHNKGMESEIKIVISRLLVNNSKFYKTLQKKQIKIKWAEIFEKFYDSNKGKILQTLFPQNIISKNDLLNLYMLINPIEWEKVILEENFKKYIPIRKLLQPEDWIFTLQNTPIKQSDDIKNIVLYFIMKLNDIK